MSQEKREWAKVYTSEVKLCPIKFAFLAMQVKPSQVTYLMGCPGSDACPWWSNYHSQCTITATALALQGIRELLANFFASYGIP